MNKPYDWNNMPLQYTGAESKDQKEQVARLMSDCGVMVKASYGLGATGANSGKIPYGLTQFMQYDKGCRFVVRASYPDEQWHRMLQENLQSGPVIFSGSGSSGGHAFVLDGYTDGKYYRTNWGWIGYANGYFVLDALNGGVADFNEGQTAVLDLKKGNQGGNYAEELRFCEGDNPKGHGLLVEPGTDFTVPFNIEINRITNMGTKTANFSCRFVLTDQKGHEKENFSFFSLGGISPGSFTSFTLDGFQIQGPIDSGDRIRMYYQTTGSSTWKLVEGNMEKGIAWEVVVKEGHEKENFLKHVNLIYDKESKQFELNGLVEGVKIKFTNLEGTDFTNLCTINSTSCKLDTKQLVAGTYVFTLIKNESGNTETAQLKVVF